MDIVQFFQNDLALVLMVLWTLPWKGVALWKAAHRNERVWFIVFLIINTLAILEIIYIFIITRRKPKKERVIAKEPLEKKRRSIFQA